MPWVSDEDFALLQKVKDIDAVDRAAEEMGGFTARQYAEEHGIAEAEADQRLRRLMRHGVVVVIGQVGGARVYGLVGARKGRRDNSGDPAGQERG